MARGCVLDIWRKRGAGVREATGLLVAMAAVWSHRTSARIAGSGSLLCWGAALGGKDVRQHYACKRAAAGRVDDLRACHLAGSNYRAPDVWLLEDGYSEAQAAPAWLYRCVGGRLVCAN